MPAFTVLAVGGSRRTSGHGHSPCDPGSTPWAVLATPDRPNSKRQPPMSEPGGGVWTRVVQIRGAGDPKISTELQRHLAPQHLRAEVDRLGFGPEVGRFATPVLPAISGVKKMAGDASQNRESSPARGLERETGFEPATLSLGTVFTESPTRCKDVQAFAIPTDPVSDAVQRSRENPLLFEDFATPLVPVKPGNPPEGPGGGKGEPGQRNRWRERCRGYRAPSASQRNCSG